MTPARLRECLSELRWSLRGLAGVLGADDRLVRRWSSGEARLPPAVALWLEELAAAHAAIPPPTNWRRRALGLAADPAARREA